MPTQQTSVTSEAGCDDARPRPDASIAAPRDAVSEKEAAGPPMASTPGILSLLHGYWRALQRWRRREGFRINLHNLSDRELMDIGLTRNDIDYIVADRAIERLRDSLMSPWPARDVM